MLTRDIANEIIHLKKDITKINSLLSILKEDVEQTKKYYSVLLEILTENG